MLRELKTFIAVARYGTFAAAGMHIGLTQSAVSSQIKSLEQALGIRLFDRTGRQAILNAAGIRALPMAREMFVIFERMSVPDTPADYAGELKIGAIATAQTGILPKALLHLRKEAPRVETKLIPGVSLNLLSQIDAGELDIAILIKPPFELSKELHVDVLETEPFVLIAPLETQGNDPLELLREQRIEERVALELDELDAIVKFVESGLGISLIPRAGLWLERQAQVRVIDLGDLTFYRQIVLVMRHGQRNLPLQRLFKACLAKGAGPAHTAQ